MLWEEWIVLMYFHHFFPGKLKDLWIIGERTPPSRSVEPLHDMMIENDWFSKSIIKKRRDISSYDHPPYHIYHHESSPIIVQCTAFCNKILILVQTSWIRPEFYTFLLYYMSKKPTVLQILHNGPRFAITRHWTFSIFLHRVVKCVCTRKMMPFNFLRSILSFTFRPLDCRLFTEKKYHIYGILYCT